MTAPSDRLQCQICDARGPIPKDLEDAFLEEDGRIKTDLSKVWIQLTFHCVESRPINVIACPRCGGLPLEVAFAGYKYRIASGRDLRYH